MNDRKEDVATSYHNSQLVSFFVSFDPFEVGRGCMVPEVVGGCVELFCIHCVKPDLVLPGQQVYIKAINGITGVSNTC